jgi:hypothetical protein
MKALPAYPSLYQIHTRVWLGRKRHEGPPAPLATPPGPRHRALPPGLSRRPPRSHATARRFIRIRAFASAVNASRCPEATPQPRTRPGPDGDSPDSNNPEKMNHKTWVTT